MFMVKVQSQSLGLRFRVKVYVAFNRFLQNYLCEFSKISPPEGIWSNLLIDIFQEKYA